MKYLLIAVLLLTGCAAKHRKPPQIDSVFFDNCKMTAPKKCDCFNIAWTRNAKRKNGWNAWCRN